jgi:hypothetical protein
MKDPDGADYPFHRYLHAADNALRDGIDAVDDPESFAPGEAPTPSPAELKVGIDYLLRRTTDISPGLAKMRPTLPGGDTGKMTDADYRALVEQLTEAVRSAAEKWWPGLCARVQALAYAEREPSGVTRIYAVKGRGMTFKLPPGCPLPPEYEGMPIMASTMPEAAINVEPPPSSHPERQNAPEPILLERTRQPPLAILPAGQHLEDHPSWQPMGRGG